MLALGLTLVEGAVDEQGRYWPAAAAVAAAAVVEAMAGRNGASSEHVVDAVPTVGRWHRALDGLCLRTRQSLQQDSAAPLSQRVDDNSGTGNVRAWSVPAMRSHTSLPAAAYIVCSSGDALLFPRAVQHDLIRSDLELSR